MEGTKDDPQVESIAKPHTAGTFEEGQVPQEGYGHAYRTVDIPCSSVPESFPAVVVDGGGQGLDVDMRHAAAESGSPEKWSLEGPSNGLMTGIIAEASSATEGSGDSVLGKRKDDTRSAMGTSRQQASTKPAVKQNLRPIVRRREPIRKGDDICAEVQGVNNGGVVRVSATVGGILLSGFLREVSTMNAICLAERKGR